MPPRPLTVREEERLIDEWESWEDERNADIAEMTRTPARPLDHAYVPNVADLDEVGRRRRYRYSRNPKAA